MKVNDRIPTESIQAAFAVLSPYVPSLSPLSLIRAIKAYEGEETAAHRPIEKPYTRREACALLGVSSPTLKRMAERGTIRRIRISPRAVRIDAESVRALMAQH